MLTAVLIIGGLGASGAAATGSESITACVNKTTGVVRVLDMGTSGAANKCVTTGPRLLHEAPLSWNLEGHAGAPGSSGADGAPGPQGPMGPEGPQGPAGADAEGDVTHIDVPVIAQWQAYSTAAGTLEAACVDAAGVYARFVATNEVEADVWLSWAAPAALVDHFVVAEGATRVLLQMTQADNHVVVRAVSGAEVVQWDIMLTIEETASGESCAMSILQTTA